MFQRFGIFLALFLFAFLEFYCFTAVSVAARSVHPRIRLVILTSYVLISALTWAIVFSFRKLNYENWSPVLKTFVIAFVLGFLVAKIFMALFMFLDDLRRLATWIFRKANGYFPQNAKAVVANPDINRSRFIARSAIVVGGLFLGGFLWGTRNKYNYTVKRVKLKFKNLPKAFSGLKIVQISDIHVGSFDDKEAVLRGIRLINEQNPDLILFTGDLINNRATELEPYIDIFSQLKAPLGVYSVMGNHDYGDYVEWPSTEERDNNIQTLKRYQAKMGWKLLDNEHVVFERAGERIALLGVENWSANLRFPKYGDLKKAHAGLKDQQIPFKILMSHDPTHWDAEVIKQFKDIDLTLSGHTHGMQFGLRLPYFQWSPVQYVYHRWAGLYKKREQHLYVNVGFGFLGYSGRVGILPEITVFELDS